MARSSAALETPPRRTGYRMPAEWEPHESTWLAWPHFAGRLAGQVRADPVGLCRDRPQSGAARAGGSDRQRASVRKRGARGTRKLERRRALRQRLLSPLAHRPRMDARFGLHLSHAARRSTADSGLLALHFQFNAWAKYPNYKLDEKIGARMAKAAGARIVHPFSRETSASCSKADRSTSTAAALCSPPKNVCSRPRNSAIRPWIAPPTNRCLPTILACSPSSGWIAASPATTRTATSMTSPASSLRIPWSR